MAAARAFGSMCLAVLLAAGASCASASTQVEVQGDAVTFRGRIDHESADRFLDAIRNPQVQRIVITSPGGQVSAALDMGEAIAARGLDVEVPVQCLSSCANYIFTAARHKKLGHPRAVGWHGNMTHVLYLDQTGQGQWDAGQMEGARWLAHREAEFFRRIGVDGYVCWFAKIAPYDVPNYYTITSADMERFGIRDVEVGHGEAPPPDGDTPEFVIVDFDRLERERPTVAIDR